MSNVLRFPSNGRRSSAGSVTETGHPASSDGASSDQIHDASADVPGDDVAASPQPDSSAQDEPRLRDLVGDVLRTERIEQGRTLADVAGDAHVSLPYLSEVERGVKDVSSDVLHSICEALELPLADVLERSVERLRIDAGAQSSTRFQLAAA